MKPKFNYTNQFLPKLLAIIMVAILTLPSARASNHEEVLLTLQHPSVGHVYVGTLFDFETNQVYLPIIELFSRFEINFQPDVRHFTIRGNFISPSNQYTINLKEMRLQLGRDTTFLTSDDFRISEMEYYLAPWVFEKVFGLEFTVNTNHLSLRLETTHTLPIQDRKARERARSRMEEGQVASLDFPLAYRLNRSFFAGKMIDYAISADYSSGNGRLGYTLSGGAQFLGGDLQGTLYGSQSTNGQGTIDVSGLRWRYAIPHNTIISGITAGSLSTTGPQNFPIRGVSITNDPIEPRRMFETFAVDGTTEPESEVEIYVNERLSGFVRADDLGYYRFDVPITYGTTRISTRIYTQSGEIIVSDRQIQVPFTFLPSGVVSYNIQAGKTENFLGQNLADRWAAHANVGIGVNRWLTASLGAQHIGKEFDAENIITYATISSRIAQQYLLSLDAAPYNFYRITGRVQYASNLSLNFNYTKFEGQTVYNPQNASDQIGANIYVPLRVFGVLAGIRFGGEHTNSQNSSITTYNADLSTRLGRVNMRLNFRDNFITANDNNNFGQGLLTSSLTYTVSRSPGIPVYVRGMFLRLQNQLEVRGGQIISSELHLSRTVMRTGRLTIGVGYNHPTNQINTQVGLTIDLNTIRSATTVNTVGSNLLARQRFTGSIGWDMPNGALTMSDRQQVGKSAAAILLFVDQNSNGCYERGEQLLPYRAVKLDRTTTMKVGRDSILRLEQLQSYYRYNLSVNRNAIADPTLVPIKNNFSFIADPNQYKRIEIPFYRGGIIEGTVMVQRGEKMLGQGGLRLTINGLDNEYTEVIRTFSDGGFYATDIPPGRYTLLVDEAQQGFISASQKEPLMFEIKALADGDYQEGLEIILVADTPIRTELLDEIDPQPQTPPSQPQTPPSESEVKEEPPLDTIQTHPEQDHEPKQISSSEMEFGAFGPDYFAAHPYIIQVGAMWNENRAIELLEKVITLTENPTRIHKFENFHKVQVLGFENLIQARNFERFLKSRGLPTYVFRVSRP